MAKGLDKLDKNLVIQTDAEGFAFFDVRQNPFTLYGLYQPQNEGHFVRIPEDVAVTVSEEVFTINRYPAGARVRFKTNATRVALRGSMPDWHGGCNGSQYSRSGFDVYARENGKYIYLGALCPPFGFNGGEFCVVANLKITPSAMRDITIYFPTANNLTRLEVGVPEGCVIEEGDCYSAPHKKVVYYGSSITMGIGAGRPSSMYQGYISRALDMDFLNLGYSGNAKGEIEMAQYIATLDMSAFVLDYDHNSPDPEHLKYTQCAFYECVRKAQPDLPIIMASRPVPNLKQGDDKARFDALWDNYQTAKAAGDNNLYFVKGTEMFLPGAEQDSLADNTHPNDLGYFGMAQAFLKVLTEIFTKKELTK